MRISDWSSDVCSSDLSDLELLMWRVLAEMNRRPPGLPFSLEKRRATRCVTRQKSSCYVESRERDGSAARVKPHENGFDTFDSVPRSGSRSEEHTSELQSLMRISYAVFCLKKKNKEQKKQRLARK